MKAIVIAVSDEVADDVARLLHGTLTINGYQVHGEPAVIDWPITVPLAPATSPDP